VKFRQENYAGFSSIYPEGFMDVYRILKIIKERQGFLPRRTKKDVEVDRGELPLSEKTFFLGGGDRVTMDARSVYVPLIPFGEKGQHILLHAVRDLLGLVEQGFSWAACEDWLKGFLTTKVFREYQKKYRKKPIMDLDYIHGRKERSQ